VFGTGEKRWLSSSGSAKGQKTPTIDVEETKGITARSNDLSCVKKKGKGELMVKDGFE